MKNLRETCIEFFANEDIRKDVKEMLKPLFSMMYNEIYIYLWLIAIYNIFFVFLLLAMFFILLHMYKNIRQQSLQRFAPFNN